MKNETKLKHTRGPWEALYVTTAWDGKLADDCDVDVYGGDKRNGFMGPLVAKLPVKDQDDILMCKDEVRANARLIAAAPNLLDALMQATMLLKHAHDDANALESQYAEEIADAITEALTKAIGETQEHDTK